MAGIVVYTKLTDALRDGFQVCSEKRDGVILVQKQFRRPDGSYYNAVAEVDMKPLQAAPSLRMP